MRAPRHEEDKEFLATNERELTRIKRRIQKIEEKKREEKRRDEMNIKHRTFNIQHRMEENETKIRKTERIFNHRFRRLHR